MTSKQRKRLGKALALAEDISIALNGVGGFGKLCKVIGRIRIEIAAVLNMDK